MPSTLTIPTFLAALLVIGHALLALFFRLHTPAEWVAFAERQPRLARFIRPGSGVEHLALTLLQELEAREGPVAAVARPIIEREALETAATRIVNGLRGPIVDIAPLDGNPFAGLDTNTIHASPAAPTPEDVDELLRRARETRDERGPGVSLGSPGDPSKYATVEDMLRADVRVAATRLELAVGVLDAKTTRDDRGPSAAVPAARESER